MEKSNKVYLIGEEIKCLQTSIVDPLWGQMNNSSTPKQRFPFEQKNWLSIAPHKRSNLPTYSRSYTSRSKQTHITHDTISLSDFSKEGRRRRGRRIRSGGGERGGGGGNLLGIQLSIYRCT